MIIGSFSWVGMKSKTRYIQASTAIPVGSLLATPGDVARDYLREKFPKRNRITTDQYQRVTVHRHHPLYAAPCRIDDAVYIDLKAAYWSIIRIVGWDVDYNPGRWLGQGSDMSDFPYDGHKLARNCLATAGLISPQTMWIADEQKLISVKRGNPMANYSLWSLLQDVLNAIASDCVKAGAVYVHTDGYICHRKKAGAIHDIIESWGLESGVKNEGVAQVFTAGTYSIGPKPNRRKIHAVHATRSIMRLVNRDWLFNRFTRFSKGQK